MNRPGTAGKHLADLYRGGPHFTNAEWARRVLDRLTENAPWILVDVVHDKELEFHVSTGHGAARVVIEQVRDHFMHWAGEELGALGLATKSTTAQQAVDCCALYVHRQVVEAADPGVGGVCFKDWPRDDWPAFQAGFIAGVQLVGGK